ncbi:MAG: hypothetical protein LBK76_01015 [Verrucomicrobiales bacterium]|jgi:hypothetical protein|nr:hypothetical protein [Verrucomicrobiales bacterium]
MKTFNATTLISATILAVAMTITTATAQTLLLQDNFDRAAVPPLPDPTPASSRPSLGTPDINHTGGTLYYSRGGGSSFEFGESGTLFANFFTGTNGAALILNGYEFTAGSIYQLNIDITCIVAAGSNRLWFGFDADDAWRA